MWRVQTVMVVCWCCGYVDACRVLCSCGAGGAAVVLCGCCARLLRCCDANRAVELHVRLLILM